MIQFLLRAELASFGKSLESFGLPLPCEFLREFSDGSDALSPIEHLQSQNSQSYSEEHIASEIHLLNPDQTVLFRSVKDKIETNQGGVSLLMPRVELERHLHLFCV